MEKVEKISQIDQTSEWTEKLANAHQA